MGVSRLAIACALVACSSKGARVVEDARRPVPADASATATVPTTTPDAAPVVAAPTTGDLAIRVEWVDVPPVARTSPGTSACGTPLPPSVSPTTTWGIPDAIVLVEGLDRDAGVARVTLDRCTLRPLVALGSSLVVESAMDRPARVTLREGKAARPIALPIAGHGVEVALAAGTRHELVTDGKPASTAWIVAGAGAVTDASGVASIRDVPPGTYPVRAWLPARAGQPAREAKGEITVAAGELSELTLKL